MLKFDIRNTDNSEVEVANGLFCIAIATMAAFLLTIDFAFEISLEFRKLLNREYPGLGVFCYIAYIPDVVLFAVVAINLLKAKWYFFPFPTPISRLKSKMDSK